MVSHPEAQPRRVAAWKHVYWALVGAFAGMGVAALLTVGIVLLAVAAALVAVGVSVPALRNRSALAIVGGLAFAPLWIAQLNRQGPGTICTTTASSVSCGEQWSPWPFVAVGVALVVGCVVLVLAAGRRSEHRAPGTPPH